MMSMQTKSLAEGLKQELEGRGEYVVRANARSGWFAVFLNTWLRRSEEARRDGREGPNLVVYRTISENPRDHYVIPYSVIRELLIESTMTTSVVNGSQRWNLTFRQKGLRVSHRREAVEVSQYHGVRLLVEEVGIGDPEVVVPEKHLADSLEIKELIRQLDELQSDRRPRTPEVLRQICRVYKGYERPKTIRRYVKRTRGTTCQLCGEFGFVKKNGERYCEVHHLFHLSKNPPPNCLAPEFVVVLCATCHRRLHYAEVGEPVRTGNGWRIRVDDTEHLFVVEENAPNHRSQLARQNAGE
jgi:5-methylcytosine-specific restriction endonuclease McrA